jgi:hypothetical protein
MAINVLTAEQNETINQSFQELKPATFAAQICAACKALKGMQGISYQMLADLFKTSRGVDYSQ